MLTRLTSATVWKVCLLSLVFMACVLGVIGLANADRVLVPGKLGTLGVTTRAVRLPRLAITSLTADSPLAAAGAKVGDEMAFDRDSDRTRFLGVNETVGVTLFIGKAQGLHREFRPRPDGTTSFLDRVGEVEALSASAFMFALGVLIGWRRAESGPMRALASSLMSQMPHFYLPLLPGDYFPNGRDYVQGLTFVVAYAGFVYFAVAYGRSAEFVRRPLVRLSLAVYFGFAIVVTLRPLLAQSLSFGVLDAPFAILSSLAALAALLFAWNSSVGVTRQRLSWILLCTGAIYLMYVATVVYLFLLHAAFQSEFQLLAGVVIAAANGGFAYAVLRRRVIDVDFVLNRTTVYAATSLLLAAVFMLASQLVNRLIHFEGREQSRWIDLTIGVAVAMMGRQTVRWVDPKVQRLLFRHWHTATDNLKRFGAEVIHQIPTGDLQSAYLDAVNEFSGAAMSALYLVQGRDTYRQVCTTSPFGSQTLTSDDPVVRQLSGSSRGLVLQPSHALAAVLALPMNVRGHLVGFVLVGPKHDGESLRPDEIELLAQSASQLGLELEVRRLQELEARMFEHQGAIGTEHGAG